LKKIGIVIPWDSPFMFMPNAFNMLNWERPEGYELNFFSGRGWCPAAKHNDGVEQAQEWGADFIMFNGGDHLCPKDIVPKMLKRIDEGWDMVLGVVPSRGVCGWLGFPFMGFAYKVLKEFDPEDYLNVPNDAIEIVVDVDPPQEIHIAGTGNILMKAEILDKLKKPYFKEYFDKDTYKRYPIQDSQFVYRCTKKANAKLLFDPDIEIAHLDVFGIDRTYRERFKDKTNKTNWTPFKDIEKYL